MLLPARKAQPQNPVHHSTPWCEESLRRGQGSTDIVLGPIEAPPGHGSAAWIPNTTKFSLSFRCIVASEQNGSPLCGEAAWEQFGLYKELVSILQNTNFG